MKFMTWTLKRPTSGTFGEYKQLASGEPWYSKNYETVDANAMQNWSPANRSFVETIEKYPTKFYAIGMHEFGIKDNGDIYNMGYANIMYPTGYFGYDHTKLVLNGDPKTQDVSAGSTDIALPVPTSLRYLMHTYPNIRWSIQYLATTNASGDRVMPLLRNDRVARVDKNHNPVLDANGNPIYTYAQDEFLKQAKRIAELYIMRGFPITDIEIDFEKPYTDEEGEASLYADLLERVKNEVCIPLGLDLRINLLAMTGDFTPAYYGWHDYATIAERNVVDEYQLMTYDFSWGGSAPGPSTPLWWLENVLEHVQDLENRGLWRSEDVFIGNAGYGRRWALGEERMGVTFDYKQLIQMQNGMYIHNDGSSVPAPTPTEPNRTEFPFRDQDFVPFGGFNDPDSDYQINYPHVYDRFWLTSNGGATPVRITDSNGNDISSVNRPSGVNYVTSYSRRQYAKFTGVVSSDFTPVLAGKTEIKDPMIMHNVEGIAPVTAQGYIALTGDTLIADGSLTYTLSGTGTYKLIALVTYPFYDSAVLDLTVNGVATTLSGLNVDWYPHIQKAHFAEVGTYTLDGTCTVEIGVTNGVHVGGFVLAQGFEDGLRGGAIDFPVSLHPFKRRGERLADGTMEIVDAQFPDVMRLVGEVLRRPPRPAIMWEDRFASYITATTPEPVTLTSNTYYPTVAEGGYVQGAWKAQYADDSIAHAHIDATQISTQLLVNKPFNGNVAVQCDLRADANYPNGRYGLRILAQTGYGTANGYVFLLDHEKEITVTDVYGNLVKQKGVVELIWEDPVTGASTIEKTVPMSRSLQGGLGGRYSIKAYFLNGKLSCWVNERVYIYEHTPAQAVTGGAYGAYVTQTTARMYLYQVASLDRWERMERLQVEVEGDPTPYVFGDVARDETLYPIDEYGFIQYTGYPAEIADELPAVGGDGTEGTGTTEQNGTVLDTETTAEDWKSDYRNKRLADVPSWQGKKNVRVTMLDAGIWFRRFYVGDAEGMSVSYNSDKIGFIRTANMVTKYKCKGIAMWTLGQEDPTIYTYLPNSN